MKKTKEVKAVVKRLQKSEAITLISLVVTIIILLILAGVTLSLITGSDGILSRATNAVDTHQIAVIKEKVELKIAKDVEEFYEAKYVNRSIDNSLKVIDYLKSDATQKTVVEGKTEYNISYDDAGNIIATYYTNNNKKEPTKIVVEGTISENGAINWNEKTDNSNNNPSTEDFKIATELITASNYGDEVNYSANGVSDWKIFYNDGNNVFLITSQCLNSTNAPLSATEMRVNGTYGLYWENGENVSFQSGCKDYKDKFMAIGTSLNYQFGEEALACISTLLNYRNWEMFGNASSKGNNITGGIAIGSPTLEMWIESWNAKGYEPLRYTSWNDNKHVGVEFKDGDNGMNGELSLTATKGYDDSLFFPNYDYRLCTPQTNGETWATGGYGLFNPWVTEEAYGLRPVVMLQSNVKAVKGNDGKWTFSM